MGAGPAIETPAFRGTPVVTRSGALKLRLDDLFRTVRPNLNDALIISFSCASDSQNVLAGSN
jgi:hypothetical protein